jgi:intergrase/recombinase
MGFDMDESQLRTIEQIEQFLGASAEVAFAAHCDDVERYAHISRVLKRFDYPRCNKHDRGVLLRRYPLR